MTAGALRMSARRPRQFTAALLVAIGLPGAMLPGARAGDTNTLASAVSVTRQFVCYANNPLLPPVVCVFAERIKRQLLTRLNLPDQWRDPIVIAIEQRSDTTPTAPAIALEMFQTDARLKYQIRCLTPPSPDERLLAAAVIETLCAEIANRDQPTSRTAQFTGAPIPPWLVHGLAGTVRGGGELLLRVARRSVVAGRPQTAAALLQTPTLPADPLERQLFEANAWILVENLLTLPDGARKVAQFIGELGRQKSVAKAFWTVYSPDFRDEMALEKWWGLQLARKTSMDVAQNLSAAEMTAQLDAILKTELSRPRGRKGTTIEKEIALPDLWRYFEEPWMKDVLVAKLNQLQALRAQAQPRYRAVIDAYVEAVNWLMKQKINRFRRAVERADTQRAAADREYAQITAYLDQAERIYAPTDTAGMFEGVFRTLEQFEELQQRRRSPISDYLDRFDPDVSRVPSATR